MKPKDQPKNSIQTIINIVAVVTILFLFIYIFIIKNDRIAYVDSGKILNEYKGAQSARKDYEAKAKIWQANIDTLSMGVQNAIRKHEMNFAKMSPKEKELSKELIGSKQKQLGDYQRAIQENAKQEDGKLTQTVVFEINNFLKEYGKKHYYKLILIANQSGTIAYAQDGLDITKDVIDDLNEDYNDNK